MKKLLLCTIFILPFFLIGCAYEYVPPQPDFKGKLENYDYEIYLKYDYYCNAEIKFTNNYKENKSPTVTLTAYDSNGINIDDTFYYFSDLDPGEIIVRDSAFLKIEYCSKINKMKISIR